MYFPDRARRLTLVAAGGRDRALPAEPLTDGSDCNEEGAVAAAGQSNTKAKI
jgi:hypothetical protein